MLRTKLSITCIAVDGSVGQRWSPLDLRVRKLLATRSEDAWLLLKRGTASLWCGYCSGGTTSPHITRLCASIALASVLAPSCPSLAHATGVERIRAESPILKAAMTTAFERSPTFRALVDRIDRSDVVVYLTCASFQSYTLRGRTLLVSADTRIRYLRVQILCSQLDLDLTLIIAHELQHVVEVASAPSVVDDRSFGELFSRIGFRKCHTQASDQFETVAAMETGRRVYKEFLHHAAVDVRSASGHGWYDGSGAEQPSGNRKSPLRPVATPAD